MKETYDHGIIIEYLMLIKRNQITKKDLEEFEKDNKEDIETYWWDEKRKKILDRLPNLVDNGNMVWCRRGDVVDEATPCKDVKYCKFKSLQEDVVRGCSRCQSFQVTKLTDGWCNAVHIDWEGD